jgi:heme O synthase-like polyprenyltransferase
MPRSTWPADYWSLTKPEVNVLIGLTTAAGFCLGRPAQLHGFPFVLGRAGLAYLAGAVVLGAGFIYRADRLAAQPSNAMARRLLVASILYLPLIFILMVLDRS